MTDLEIEHLSYELGQLESVAARLRALLNAAERDNKRGNDIADRVENELYKQ